MFTLPELPYAPELLEPYIDKETLLVHHGKHHAACVKNLNDLLPGKNDSDLVSILSNLDSVPEDIRTKVRNNAGGVLNHTLYWNWMSSSRLPPSVSLIKMISKTFGSLDIFREKFIGAALSQFGSGWSWLVSVDNRLEIVTTPNQDSPYSGHRKPILGVDVWEHAYYLKYQNRRAEYLEAWWNVINWPEVERLLTV